ncbi:hypothetical protein MNV49_003341 [Pseudohyphozyma bogoriensis]|nr:hypothetical protein MNV49_003341 [Pseudohyphozyma bogoriensis]
MLASVLSFVALAGLSSAATHQVVVGGSAGLVYTPNQITAAVGDTVEFIFQSKNHTLTQSSFATPCVPLVNATTGATGFDSGYVPVAANATKAPAWTLEVTVSTPIWFYCAQANHCESGMVGAINAPATGNKTFAAFMANAVGGNSSTTTSGSAGGASVASSGIGATATGALSSVDAASATSAADSAASSAAATSSTTTGGAATLRTSATALVLCAGLAFALL